MTLRIRLGTLIDGTGAPAKPDAVVVVENGRFTQILSTSEHRGQIDVDLSGSTAIPGLVDAHDHLDLDVGDEELQSREPASYLTLRAIDNARRILNAGITTMRYPGAAKGVDLELKRAIDAGETPGPRLMIAGQPIMRTGGHAHFLGREADGVDDMRRAVREQLKKGADFIKIMVSGGMSTAGSSPLTQELADEEIATAIDEAHRAGVTIAAHAHGGPGVDVALAHGIDTIEHGVLLTREQIQNLASSGAVLVSTAAVTVATAGAPEAPFSYREKSSAAMAHGAQMLKWAKAANVTVAVGTDTAHARMDLEMQALLDAGWTALEAIRSLTLNGARAMRRSDELGSVEIGKVADLVVLDRDPLSDSAALLDVRRVMKDGAWVD